MSPKAPNIMPILNKLKRREYNRKWIAARRLSFFKDKTCTSCSETMGLELHHKDPSLKISHRIWSWTEQRREEEISKCEVLCNECHQKETNKQLSKPVVHGVSYTYDKLKCRCSDCKHAKSVRNAKRIR